MTKLTHLQPSGDARMVDVSAKPETAREAIAAATLHLQPETLALIRDNNAPKGDVLAAARLAGIMAAKQTAALIPLCHPIALTSVTVELSPGPGSIDVTATARTTGRTGVEMEALTAVTIAALTLYDMLKSADRAMRIDNIRVTHKSGGKSGEFSQP